MNKEDLQELLCGMSVSVDVSTGEHDAFNRYFGKVTEVIDIGGNRKYGLMILVQDEVEPNFSPPSTLVWVSCKDLLPVKSKKCIISTKSDSKYIAEYWGDFWVLEDGDRTIENVFVKYWSYIPEAPCQKVKC